jgi:hypothetical protein
MAACFALLVLASCREPAGYNRPPDRNRNAIGAPAKGVGTGGLEFGPGPVRPVRPTR